MQETDLLKELMEIDSTVAEVTRPQANQDVNRLLIKVGVLIQATILINNTKIGMDDDKFIVVNTNKSKPIR
jgi:hypothetical protein